MKQDEWKNKLKSRLEDSQVSPPMHLWEYIEKELDMPPAGRPAFFVPPSALGGMAAVLIIALFLGMAIWWNANDHTAPTKKKEWGYCSTLYTKNIEKQNKEAEGSYTPIAEKLLTAIHTPTYTQKMYKNAPSLELQTNSDSTSEVSLPTIEKKVTPSEHTTEQQPQISDKTTIKEEKSLEYSTVTHRVSSPSTRKKQISLGLYAANTLSEAHNRLPVQMSPLMASTFRAEQENDNMSAAKSATIYLSDTYEQEEHYMPLSFGISVGYPLHPRWTLSAALIYTKLASTLTQTTAMTQVKTQQTLHNMGLQLNLQYYIWKGKTLSIYTAAGGQADMNVSAKAHINGMEQQLKHQPVQFALTTSAGLQYNFTPSIGIYAEPGIKYYPRTKASLKTIYQKHPLHFDLQMGVRISLAPIMNSSN